MIELYPIAFMRDGKQRNKANTTATRIVRQAAPLARPERRWLAVAQTPCVQKLGTPSAEHDVTVQLRHSQATWRRYAIPTPVKFRKGRETAHLVFVLLILHVYNELLGVVKLRDVLLSADAKGPQ